MKKIFLSLGIILSLGLASCGNKNKEQITEQSSQIEELEKKVSTLEETADSSDKPIALPDEEINNILLDITSDTNKKFAKAFLNKGLMMYGNNGEGPGENPEIRANNEDGLPPRLVGMSFYTEPQNGLIITLENFSTTHDMNNTIEFHKNNELFDYEIKANTYTNSIMYFSKKNESLELDKTTFDKYLEVFESVR